MKKSPYPLLTVALFAAMLAPLASEPGDAFSPAFRMEGRYDADRPEGPVLFYAGSFIETRFEGTSARATFADLGSSAGRQHIAFIVNGGEQRIVEIGKNAVTTFDVADDLPEGEHHLILVRLDNPGSSAAGLQFRSLQLDPGKRILPPAHEPALRIEFYGDSFTAGAQAGVDRANNGWNSFPNVAARLLNAELHNNGIGGLAVLDDTGFYQATENNPPLRTGFVTTFDKLNPGRWTGGYTPWDFNRFQPDIVVFGFGINDQFGLGGFPDPALWSEEYLRVIRTIADQHGKDEVTLILHPANIRNDAYKHGPDLVAHLRNEGYRAHWFTFSFDITEHPDTVEAQTMGEELAAFIRNLTSAPAR